MVLHFKVWFAARYYSGIDSWQFLDFFDYFQGLLIRFSVSFVGAQLYLMNNLRLFFKLLLTYKCDVAMVIFVLYQLYTQFSKLKAPFLRKQLDQAHLIQSYYQPQTCPPFS